ncbi:MAG: metal-dependent transcriptional regulator [Atopobiaceae bacterium]
MPKLAEETRHELSMASEDYLESIYRIMCDKDESDEGVRSVDVAEQLKVSKASVNKAISTLKDAGMVEQMRYGRVRLTEEGEKYASRVWKTHRTIRAFLIHDLGVDAEVANREACLMEHYLSAGTVSLWCKYLEKQGYKVDD